MRLLQDVQAEQIPGHIYRGYTILTKNSKTNHSMDLQVSYIYTSIICSFKIIKFIFIYLVLFW